VKRTAVAVALLIGAMLPAQASSQNKAAACMAKVIKSEELPYAPMGYWLVRATLQVTPPAGPVFETTLQDRMPLQAYPPRRGETFRLWCDPADPTNLHRI
jgi:hypothetical protein